MDNKLSKNTTVVLNNGVKIPLLGLGTYCSTKNEVGNAVICALKDGYRHIDTATCYGNEAEIGSAI